MLIIQEIKKAIYAKYNASTLFTVDHVPLYLDHVPNIKTYPIICLYPINSNQTMAMPSAIKTEGFDYSDGRWQFSIYGNDRNQVQLEDIADRLETIFHRSTLSTGNGVSHIATISLNQSTLFFDQGLKIWTIRIDFRIIAGK